MKITVVLIVTVCIGISLGQSITENSNNSQNKTSKSIFGSSFDEIVVESSLTVKRKPGGSNRIARNKNITTATVTEEKKVVKRQINRHKPHQPAFGGGAAAANSQAQGFNAFGPVGSFGASATGAQTQSFGFGRGGPAGSAGFSGTQQYMFNGQTVDISFGNAFSGAKGAGANGGAAAITVTGPDGKKRKL